VSKPRDLFFLVMPALFLIIVVCGFARSFYLQEFFGFPKLPMHLVIHGLVLTAWFTLSLVQPSLIKLRLPQVHRKVGMIGLILAGSVLVTGIWTLVVRDAPEISEYPSRAAGNIGSLFMFLYCVGLAYRFRKVPEKHKRLMLMGSIPLLAPALDRVGRIPALNIQFGDWFSWFPAPPEVAFALVSFLSLLMTVVIHDLLRKGSVHSGTIWGLTAILVVSPLSAAAVTASGSWAAFVMWVT
jgi:hypothetical protein